MIETISGLPKYSTERGDISRQIRRARKMDRKSSYTVDRDLTRYLNAFNGLKSYFEYVRSLGGERKILDIGVGKGIAFNELQESYGEEFQFIGTALTGVYNRTGENTGKILHTSAELLTGIESESINGVLSCYSMAYSVHPKYAVRRIHEVLVPGGIIKSVFLGSSDQSDPFPAVVGLKKSSEFEEELHELGYDVAIDTNHPEREILLAIKPGNEILDSASTILLTDHVEFKGY